VLDDRAGAAQACGLASWNVSVGPRRSAACQRTQIWSSSVWYIGWETTLPTRLEV
jgi:hypothetical protein